MLQSLLLPKVSILFMILILVIICYLLTLYIASNTWLSPPPLPLLIDLCFTIELKTVIVKLYFVICID